MARADRRRLRRGALLASLVLPAALAAWGVPRLLAGGASGTREHTVQRSRLAFRVKATGELASASSFNAGPPGVRHVWEFTITELAPEGKPIRQGEPLVRFDDKQLRERLDVQRSDLAAAEKELEKTTLEEQERLDGLLLQRAELARRLAQAEQKLAVPEDMLARLELEKLRYELELARTSHRLNDEQIEVQKVNMQAAVEAARAQVERLRRDAAETQESVQRMAVTAPRDGFVVYVPNWEKKKPVVGDSVWYGQAILEVADLSRMQVNAVIPERDAALVAAGQEVEIRLAANPDRLFRGRVRSLGRIFRTKSYDKPSTVFDAVIGIDQPDADTMRPGMAADLVILARAPEERPCIPEDALGYADGVAQVTVRRDGRAQAQPVRLGRRSPPWVEVVDGLAAGDVVLLEPATLAPRGRRP
ncbi:MAG: efflux RND transporter periplasmic adaptor subunit [Acidobacteria bacterium]|nr:efflux RND transporter periplasmic adaptor subunit [Acidobacteriota bacterium]